MKFESLKEMLPLAVAAIGLFYGIGWIAEALLFVHLNLAPLTVRRELAVSAGVATLASFLPVVVVSLLKVDARGKGDFSRLRWLAMHDTAKVLALVILLPLSCFGLFLVFQDGENTKFLESYRTGTRFVDSLLFVLVLQVSTSTFALTCKTLSSTSRIARSCLVVLCILTLSIHLIQFTRYILPRLNGTLGGLCVQHVRVQADQLASRDLVLVASDDMWAIFADPDPANRLDSGIKVAKHKAPLIRVPWAKINAMTEIRPEGVTR